MQMKKGSELWLRDPCRLPPARGPKNAFKDSLPVIEPANLASNTWQFLVSECPADLLMGKAEVKQEMQ
jgi:hypothetical protein